MPDLRTTCRKCSGYGAFYSVCDCDDGMEKNMDKTTDVDGRAYAKLSEVRPGTILEADPGFTCLKAGERVKVIKDYDGSLFIPCADGGHHLDGQADDGEHLIGLYQVSMK